MVPRRSVPFGPAETARGNRITDSGNGETEPGTPILEEVWDSEDLAAASDALLEQLSQWARTDIDTEPFPSISAEDFSAPPLNPNRRQNSDTPHRRLEEALRGFLAGTLAEKAASRRLSFKMIQVQQLDKDRFQTETLVELAYPAEHPTLQRNSRWRCHWNRSASTSGAWLLKSIEALSGTEATHLDGGSIPRFREVTATALGESSRLAQHGIGVDQWSQQLTRIDEMTLFGHHGLAIGDVNGDGLDDLYLCDGGGLPNRLYLHQPDGTLKDVSAESRTDWLESSSAALLIDLDGDGDQDLVVATVPLILFSENDGRGHFRFRGGHEAAPGAYALAAADYDADGDLDIYATNYSGREAERLGERGFEARAPHPFHDANNGGPNALLENLGNFEFADVTEAVGLDVNNRRFSFSASWEDLDLDGDPDLYVANDFGRNCLYQNDGGRFTEVAGALGVDDIGAGMSVDWGDANRDGRMDLYVGNMFSGAGNRVLFQSRFTEGREAAEVEATRRMTRGNSLFLNEKQGVFADVGERAGVNLGLWAWSSLFIDVNNDGWEDLLVANGYLSNRRPDDL